VISSKNGCRKAFGQRACNGSADPVLVSKLENDGSPLRGPVLVGAHEADDLRRLCRGSRVCFNRILRRHELALYGTPASRIALVEGLYVRDLDGDDRMAGLAFQILVRKGLQNQARMIRAGFRDARKPLERPLQMRPVLDDRRPVAAILERAIQEAVRQRIVGRKHVHALGDVDDMRPVRKGYDKSDFSSVILASFIISSYFREPTIRSANRAAGPSLRSAEMSDAKSRREIRFRSCDVCRIGRGLRRAVG
jgi:hypothetical protein